MRNLQEAKELLDEINRAISDYDPVLKEKARDILLERAFGAPPSSPASAPGGRGGGRADTRGNDLAGADFASLLARWTPDTMSDQALLGVYYLTRTQGVDRVTSQAINTELKRNGLAIANITRAIEANLRPSRALMVQEGKSGSTKQARKQYSITAAGIEAVERRLRG